MLYCVESKTACRPSQVEVSLISSLAPWQLADVLAEETQARASLPTGSSGHASGCWQTSFMFQTSAQNKGYFGNRQLMLIFAINCILNLKSLTGKNGTSVIEESAS